MPACSQIRYLGGPKLYMGSPKLYMGNVKNVPVSWCVSLAYPKSHIIMQEEKNYQSFLIKVMITNLKEFLRLNSVDM